jgi:hypothetical protein
MTLIELLKTINTEKGTEIILSKRNIKHCLLRDENPVLCQRKKYCTDCPMFDSPMEAVDHEDLCVDGTTFLNLNYFKDFLLIKDYFEWHVSEIKHYEYGLNIVIEEESNWSKTNG